MRDDDDDDFEQVEPSKYDYDPDEFADVGDDTVLKVGRSMLDDIDDRINTEFGAELFGVTARSSQTRHGIRIIQEE